MRQEACSVIANAVTEVLGTVRRYYIARPSCWFGGLSFRPPGSALGLLNVNDLASEERHFEVFINVDLLGAEVDYFFRLPQGALHLIGGHSHLNGLWLSLLLTATTLALRLAALLLLSALLLLLLVATLRVLRIVAD